MNRFFKISLLLLIYLVCSARSCSNREEDSVELKTSRDSVTRSFQEKEPAMEALTLKETVAIQLLNDLADYLNIWFDPNTTVSFRVKAGEMAKRCFLTDDNRISLMGGNNLKISQISTIIQSMNTVDKLVLNLDSIKVINHLKKLNDTLYSGKIQFFQKLSREDASHRKVLTIEKRDCEFYAVKRNKNFGSDNFRVWDVKLGNIDP